MNEQLKTAPAEAITRAFTDGSCHGNPGPGGRAYHYIRPDGSTGQGSAHAPMTTNNREELAAAIDLLENLEPGERVHVHADSQYLCKGCTEWIDDWKAKGWKNSSKKPVKNKDLWIRLDELLQSRRVTFEHVKAHAGNPGNEHVDELANQAALGEIILK